MNNDREGKEIQDEILIELWEAKDQYSKSCSSNFANLVKNIKKDIKKINFDPINTIDVSKVA